MFCLQSIINTLSDLEMSLDRFKICIRNVHWDGTVSSWIKYQKILLVLEDA
jgi:hypothetical protein